MALNLLQSNGFGGKHSVKGFILKIPNMLRQQHQSVIIRCIRVIRVPILRIEKKISP
jgi:hypothetical protein